MLTYLHAPRRAVLDAFREDPDVLVGPESESGWTVAWISEVEDLEHVERAVVVDLDEVENRVDLWVRGAGGDGTWCWEPDEFEAEGASTAEEGGACGLELYRGEDLLAARNWGTGWEQPFFSDQETQDAFAGELQVLSATPALPRLRSLLRNDAPSGDPLAELAEVLSLPPTALALLDQRADAARSETLVPAGPWGFLRGLLTGRGIPPLAPPRLLLLYAALCGIGALVLGLLFATGIAVIATGGAFVDQQGVMVEDWVFLVVAGIGTVGLGLTAVHTARVARQAE